MSLQFFREHQYKIIVGAPIIFLLLINTNILGSGNTLVFHTDKSVFLTIGEDIPVQLNVSTNVSTNVVGGTVTFPSDLLSVVTISRESSIIDLWSEEPTVSNQNGTIHFSGGIIPRDGNSKRDGNVLTINVRTLKPGTAKIAIADGQLLSADGSGSNIISGTSHLSLYVRAEGQASPDVNGDGTLSLSDVSTLYLKTFHAYDRAYDLNGDGKVDFADIRALIALL